MNLSPVDLLSQGPRQPVTIKIGYLSRVEMNFVQKNYGKTFEELVIFFSSQESDDEVKRAYGYLCDIMPHLEANEIRSLKDKIYPKLHALPQLTQQQLDLALALAGWYISRPFTGEESLYQNAVQAMHYYTKALAVAKKHHPDRLSSLHLLAS